eukprot:8256838-Pyramimonas_sp.AAC.1
MSQHLRLLGWNPQSCTGERLEEVVAETSNFDLILLAGTQAAERRQQRHGSIVTKRHVLGRCVLEAPFGPSAPLSNVSAGCSVILGKGLQEKHVMQVWASPSELKGRCLAVRVKRGRCDLCAVSLYFPPKPSSLQQRAQYLRTVKALCAWLRDVLASLPLRTTPIVYCDANDGIGIAVGGSSVETRVVQAASQERLRRGAGESLREVLEPHDMFAANARGTE